MNSSDRFSKVKLLQILGLLSKRFNYETLKFESYWPLRVWFYVSMFLEILTLKLFISYYYPKTNIAQLYLGNIFNFLGDNARFFTGKKHVSLKVLLYVHLMFTMFQSSIRSGGKYQHNILIAKQFANFIKIYH